MAPLMVLNEREPALTQVGLLAPQQAVPQVDWETQARGEGVVLTRLELRSAVGGLLLWEGEVKEAEVQADRPASTNV